MKHFLIVGSLGAIIIIGLSYTIGYWVANGWKAGSK